ncbi:MAG: regulatory iron-sulfur-containing complex subunit RicT [Candidatus Wallbacteria bacterium]|nr:regulatory iron-sulfur-containing complex subunit RicT [Candidatus Wallbacteria bacterium]
MDDEKLLQYKLMFLDPEDNDALKKLKEEDEDEDRSSRKKVEIPDYARKYLHQEADYALCIIEEIRATLYAPLDSIPEGFGPAAPEDIWVVNTERGRELVRVVRFIKHKLNEPDIQHFARLQKKAVEADLQQEERNRERETKALDICKKKIEKLNLVMKLVKVHYLFDGGRIMFFFTAPSKVDFRELVKQLASVFRTRIELRQIGVRDETKLIGGIGPCGMHVCCHRFLCNFKSVSIKMAKDQNLVLNPGKISGICGRLLCCLNYENKMYVDEKRRIPEIDESVVFENKRAKVLSSDTASRTVKLMFEDESVRDVKVEYLTRSLT